jgi:hypothetical protein
MKTLLTSLAAVSLFILGSSQSAEARGYESRVYISSYLPCGTPVYTERYYIGRDRCVNPVWSTRVVRQHHRPVARPVYVAPCPPRYIVPQRCDVPRGGVNFGVRFGYSR